MEADRQVSGLRPRGLRRSPAAAAAHFLPAENEAWSGRRQIPLHGDADTRTISGGDDSPANLRLARLHPNQGAEVERSVRWW